MAATLPATHLLRQFLLFASIVVFLLLLARAGYALWQFQALEGAVSPGRLFLTGLRFDLSLVGGLCLVPLVIGSLLGMFETTRALAKGLVVACLVAGLAIVLGTELLTPYFIGTDASRPTAAAFADPSALATTVGQLAVRHPIPSATGALLVALVLAAYVARMEPGRLLRYRLSRPSALVLAVVGGLVCLALLRSQLDPRVPALSLADARLGGEPVVDEIATNSGWTTLHSLLAPWPWL